jgi:integrase
VEQDALDWRRQIRDAGELSSETQAGAVRAAAEMYVRGGYRAVEKAARLHHDGYEEDALLELGGPKAKAFVEVAFLGKRPLRPYLDPWAAIRGTEVEPKTAAMDKAAVSRFIEAFPLVDAVTKAEVADWIERRKGYISATSVQREVTGIRSFWGYLQTRGEVSADLAPFAGQRFKDRRKDRAKARRVAFKAGEVSALYAASLKSEDHDLADLIALAAYTGARREELCALKVEDVAGGWITIRDAKTSAGLRDIPIHNAIAPTLRRLIGKRKSGYVLDGLSEDQYGNRGDALGKRFTRLKTALGHGPDKTLHSIRHAFAHILRERGVVESLVSDLMGHRLAGMTFARYGRAGSRKLLPAALARLKYPKPL